MDEYGTVSNDLTFDTGTGYVPDSSVSSDQVNSSPSAFSPATANPTAQSFADVLLNGFSRTVDAVTAPESLTNTQPVTKPASPVSAVPGAKPAASALSGGVGLLVLVALGLVALRALR